MCDLLENRLQVRSVEFGSLRHLWAFCYCHSQNTFCRCKIYPENQVFTFSSPATVLLRMSHTFYAAHFRKHFNVSYITSEMIPCPSVRVSLDGNSPAVLPRQHYNHVAMTSQRGVTPSLYFHYQMQCCNRISNYDCLLFSLGSIPQQTLAWRGSRHF